MARKTSKIYRKRVVARRRPQSLPERVYRLQITLVRRVNDTHIFVQQALHHLRQAKERYATSRDPNDKPYAVPSHGKSGIAKRRDDELRSIYDRYIGTDLYSYLLVAMVSQCESFIFEVLRLVLQTYPRKITTNIQGVEFSRNIDANIVLDAETIDEARQAIIDQRLHSLSYAAPKDYLRFLRQIAHVTTTDKAFEEYIEVKATRDIIIHNDGIANETYSQKAGTRIRAENGEQLPMDEAYFDHCVAIIKRVAGIIKTDIEEHFTNQAEGEPETSAQ